MKNISELDKFEYWLMDMNSSLEEFIDNLPADVTKRMDYSADSLLSLEQWLIQKYPSIDDLKKMTEAKMADGAARYLGETFRKNLGGKWIINFEDPKNAFYARPQLSGMKGQTTQICPLSLVSACIARRTGTFIRTIFDNLNNEDTKF